MASGAPFDPCQDAHQVAGGKGDVIGPGQGWDDARDGKRGVARRCMAQGAVLKAGHRRGFGKIGDLYHETSIRRIQTVVQVTFRCQRGKGAGQAPMDCGPLGHLICRELWRGAVEKRAKGGKGHHGFPGSAAVPV